MFTFSPGGPGSPMSPSSPRSPWSNKQNTDDIVLKIGGFYIFLHILTESPLGPGGPSGPGGPCGGNQFSCEVKKPKKKNQTRIGVFKKYCDT